MGRYLSAFLFFWAVVNPIFGQTRALEPGEVFPSIALPALEDGRPLSVADFRGQKLVLHIWASW